ncbi:hypothetical protein NUW58_g5724 [Xylaria curta]|uniref:Uncharacterized protein n=1 Tax=Xylaria curta TaxID=42375 RepID=A0ACC1P081_9PEZI|nr:hypothetical protein NUW58_g5724 [Xylaria curta]
MVDRMLAPGRCHPFNNLDLDSLNLLIHALILPFLSIQLTIQPPQVRPQDQREHSNGKHGSGARSAGEGADVDDLEIVFGRTALHEAVDKNDADMVHVTARCWCDPLRQDKGLRNCISIATYRKDSTILGIILDAVVARLRPSSTSAYATDADLGNVDIDVLVTTTNRHGNTPLHSAAKRSYADTAAILLQHGANFWRTQGVLDSHGGNSDVDGDQNSSRTVKLLIDSKATLTDLTLCRDLLGVAIESSSIEICLWLVEQHQHCHEIATREDCHGWTPLMVAFQARQADIAALLKPYDTQGLLEKLERQPEYVAGLSPTRWNVNLEDKLVRIALSTDGLEVFPRQHIHVSIGVASRYTTLDIHPGWSAGWGPSFGYHSDDGGISVYEDESVEDILGGPTYNAADTVGCGLDFVKGTIFFTHNGVLLGEFLLPRDEIAPAPKFAVQGGRFFPAVGMGDEIVCVRANFGADPETPFEYDPDTYGTETTRPNGLSKGNHQNYVRMQNERFTVM